MNYTRLTDSAEVIFTTQGRPISPDDEIRILDPDGNAVPDGTPGALATRGPYTFRGYFRSPDHNATAFDADGFYHSGDVVVRQGGNLRVVGRIKDQINRGGEKIAAEEIENLLLRHPDITHAALVGVDDSHLGEKSCAFLVLRDGAGKLAAGAAPPSAGSGHRRIQAARPLPPIARTAADGGGQDRQAPAARQPGRRRHCLKGPTCWTRPNSAPNGWPPASPR